MPAEPTDPASGPGAEPTLLQRLKERKLVQWALAYLAGAFVVFQLLDALAEPLGLTTTIQRAILAVVGAGFFITLVLAWYHGEKGRQRVSGPELLMVAALLVVAGVALTVLGSSGDRTPVAFSREGDDRPGIAVLACENISPNPEDAYYADGLHEEILVRLQKISSLFSVGRASVLKYRETLPLPSEIARELQVEFIGGCGVRKDEDRIRLTFQLLDGRTGGLLWADTYDRDLTAENLFEIESEVAQQVAREVGAQLTPEEMDRLEEKPTESLGAYEAYLLGLYHLGRRDDLAGAFSEAIRYFHLAIQQDPDMADAHAGLAGAYTTFAWHGVRDPRELWPQVERWARSALAIDSNNGTALHLLGHYRWIQEGDWDAGEEVFRRSVELTPGAYVAHVTYADFLMAQGRIADGLEEGRIATALDPLSSHILASQARWAVLSRRYDEADRLSETLLTRDPNNTAAVGTLAAAFLLGGQPERVPQLFQGRFSDPASLTPTHRAFFAMYLGAVGQADSARIELDRAASSAEDQYLDPTVVWSAYAALGEKDEAIHWIERGIESRSVGTVLLGVSPFADPLRDDPRYQAILDRVGLGHLEPRFDSLAAAAVEILD